MPTSKKPDTRKKRGPVLPKTGNFAATARPPQESTLTLGELRQLLSETIDCRLPVPEIRNEFLQRRRDRIESGDLIALYSALYGCLRPLGPGTAYHDARPGAPTEPTSYVPEWLLTQVLKVLWDGIDGKWPKGPAIVRRWSDARLDVWRAWHVLRAREEEVPWQEVFQHVADKLDGGGGESAVEKAYSRVIRNLRRDPDYYRRLDLIFEP